MELSNPIADATGCDSPTVLLPISHERLSDDAFTREDGFNKHYDYSYNSFCEQNISLSNVQEIPNGNSIAAAN